MLRGDGTVFACACVRLGGEKEGGVSMRGGMGKEGDVCVEGDVKGKMSMWGEGYVCERNKEVNGREGEG